MSLNAIHTCTLYLLTLGDSEPLVGGMTTPTGDDDTFIGMRGALDRERGGSIVGVAELKVVKSPNMSAVPENTAWDWKSAQPPLLDGPVGGAISEPVGGAISEPVGGANSEEPVGGANSEEPVGGANSEEPVGGANSEEPVGGATVSPLNAENSPNSSDLLLVVNELNFSVVVVGVVRGLLLGDNILSVGVSIGGPDRPLRTE